MTSLAQVCEFLQSQAPCELAEDWDNVGLLVGRKTASVQRIMTCLTVTPASAAEAVREKASLVVVHHPLPFQPLKTITDEDTPGRLVLDLIEAGVAIYSPHTAFDSAAEGINRQLAEGIGLLRAEPILPAIGLSEGLGAGRVGDLPKAMSLTELAGRLKAFLKIDTVRGVGDASGQVRRVGVACGSGGSFLVAARDAGCEALVTGEASFHMCLEAEATGLNLLLVGHYASERFGVEYLAELLASEFADLTVWASRDEADPLMKL